MKPNDLYPALIPVINSFKRLGVLYYIGGSIASSIHGIPRTTMDVDIVADIKQAHVEPFFDDLKENFYIDKDIIFQAIRNVSSFNIIHFETMMKIDVFVLKGRDFDRESFKRKKPDTLDEEDGSNEFYVASPEDIILNKLEWYRMGGEVSERQWGDAMGVVKVQGAKLDFDYLEKWAKELGLPVLLDRLLKECE